VPDITVRYVGTLGFPDVPIQGNFPVYGSTGAAAPDWRPFRATGYTEIDFTDGADGVIFEAGNDDTDLPTADLFLHVQVIGRGGVILGDFASGPLGFAGTLNGETNGYTTFQLDSELGVPDIMAVRLNVTTLQGGGFNPLTSDWTVLDNVVADNTALCLVPCVEGPDVPAPVPEPSVWALMIAGFGLAGAALRRRAVIGER
jgi:hypothetical protein